MNRVISHFSGLYEVDLRYCGAPSLDDQCFVCFLLDEKRERKLDIDGEPITRVIPQSQMFTANRRFASAASL